MNKKEKREDFLSTPLAKMLIRYFFIFLVLGIVVAIILSRVPPTAKSLID